MSDSDLEQRIRARLGDLMMLAPQRSSWEREDTLGGGRRRARSAPHPVALVIAGSAAGWIAMVGHSGFLPSGCVFQSGSMYSSLLANARLALWFDQPTMWVPHWFTMATAMTSLYLWRSAANPAHLELDVLGLSRLAAGFCLTWALAGVVLFPIVIAMQTAAAALGVTPLVVALSCALIWPLAPPRRAYLALSARRFCGDGVEGDPFRSGTRSALSCVGAFWALMLAPMTAREYGPALMAGAMAVQIIECEIVARATCSPEPFSSLCTEETT